MRRFLGADLAEVRRQDSAEATCTCRRSSTSLHLPMATEIMSMKSWDSTVGISDWFQ